MLVSAIYKQSILITYISKTITNYFLKIRVREKVSYKCDSKAKKPSADYNRLQKCHVAIKLNTNLFPFLSRCYHVANDFRKARIALYGVRSTRSRLWDIEI